MKKRVLPAVVATAAVALLPAVAAAQSAATADIARPTLFGTLGYAESSLDHVDLGALQVRLGARLSTHVGVEAEGSWGVQGGSYTKDGARFSENLGSQEAVYGVGYLPVLPNLELLARIGYGHTSGTGPKTVFVTEHGTLEVPVHDVGFRGDSWNFGAGGQYMFDATNGVRVDYLREEFRNGDTPDANVWSMSYLRTF